MIQEMKDYLKTTRPSKDQNGHKIKELYLKDYVLYALLREKADFTKCSHNKQAAISEALDLVSEIYRLKMKLIKQENRYTNYFAIWAGDRLTIENLTEMEEIINKQLAKHNV